MTNAQINKLEVGQQFYDIRLDAYFTVSEIVDDVFVTIEYPAKPHRNKKEAVEYIMFLVYSGQYLPKIA